MSPLTTFHPFPRLPWELRNEIWKQSIRPLDRPGAHILCLDHRELKDATAKECDVQCPRIPVKPAVCEEPPSKPGKNFIHVTVPGKTLSSGPTGNPSAYMIDGGLWTACKELRSVMERTFNHQKWDPIRKAYPAYWKLWNDTIHDRMMIATPPPPSVSGSDDSSSPPPPPPRRERRERAPSPVDPYDAAGLGYRKVPATAFFRSSPSLSCSPSSNDLEKPDGSKGDAAPSPHYFTVLPMQDLIIIRPTAWESYLNESYWHSFELGFPFGAEKYGFPGFCGWKGFALEYDPRWGEKPEFAVTWRDRAIWDAHDSYKLPEGAIGVFDILANAISIFSDNEKIQTSWLIDYRLKPKRGTPPARGRLESSQKVYHGGGGSRFVEIYPKYVAGGGDYLAEYYTEGIDSENSATGEGSCHWFIEEFEACIFGDVYDSESVDSDYSRFPPHIGLLACLP